jgi:hypothetical protein
MVWAGIAHDFKSKLMLVDGNVNAEKYQKIIAESGVIEAMNNLYGSWVFQDDGASSHTARSTRDWLTNNHIRTPDNVKKWPPHSPDLNVIEPTWSILKSQMLTMTCRDKPQLFHEASRVWDLIPLSEINALVDSFHVRLRAVIILEGESLNGHRQLLRELTVAGANAMEIAARVREEMQEYDKFLRDSRELFTPESMAGHSLGEIAFMSFQIMTHLPLDILNRTKFFDMYKDKNLIRME